MSTHNIGFYEDLTKFSFNYHQISSNTHLISSSGTCMEIVRDYILTFISNFLQYVFLEKP